jgi:hypothetical protein
MREREREREKGDIAHQRATRKLRERSSALKEQSRKHGSVKLAVGYSACVSRESRDAQKRWDPDASRLSRDKGGVGMGGIKCNSYIRARHPRDPVGERLV